MFCKNHKSLVLASLTILCSIGLSTIYNIYGVSDVFAATASLSTTGSVNIDVSASGNSANVGSDTLTVNTTCSTGYTVTIQSSINDTTLYKDGDSTSNSKITPTNGTLSSPLPIIGDDGNGTSYLGTWGYSMTSSAVTGTFTGLNSTPTIIKQSTTASATGGDQFPVYFGVSVTPTLEPGNYTMAKDPNNNNNPGTIVYQLTMPVGCQTYNIKYDGNGATGSTTMSNQDIPSNATELDLWPSNYSRANYGFAGWSTTQLNPDSANASTELANAVNAGKVYGPMETITIDSTFTANANQDKEITLYAVWVKYVGDIQNWKGCGSMTNGQVTALKDTRDNNVYTVAKLADGNCWMIENLRLGGTNPITLTSANSNVTSNFTLSVTTDPTQTAWCKSTDANCYNQSMLNSTNTTNPVSDMTTSSLNSNDNTGIYSLGNYYNWYSATAGTGTYSTSANNTSVTSSVCPAGWHLPKGGNKNNQTNNEYWNLIVTNIKNGTNPANYSNSTYPYYAGATEAGPVEALLRKYPNNYLRSGYVNNASFLSRGGNGLIWSSTVDSSNAAYYLNLRPTDVYPGTYYAIKYNGYSVRCVADPPQTLSTITTMQEMTSDICSATTVGTTATLRDTRDNSTYSVAKLADGKCWMTQNMRLDFSKLVENISADNTNNPSSTFITTANAKPAANNGTWCTTDSSACYDQLQYNTVNIGNASYDSYGVYYNWYTATAGNGTYSMSNQNTNTTGDICPKGWHLPTGGTATDTDFKALNNAINSGSTSNSSGLISASANFLYSGVVIGSSVFLRGSNGYYWSSTANSSGNAYGLYFSSSDVYPGTSSSNKYYGFSVRCVQ